MSYAAVACVSDFPTPWDKPDPEEKLNEQVEEEMKNLTVDRYSDALFVAGSEYKTAEINVGILKGTHTAEDLRESVKADLKTLIKMEIKERA